MCRWNTHASSSTPRKRLRGHRGSRHRGAPPACDNPQRVNVLIRKSAAVTPLLAAVAGAIVLTSALVVARGALFYSSRLQGIRASGNLALITWLVALVLLYAVRQRSTRMKAIVVAGALAVMMSATAWRGVENFWAVNTTREMARLAAEFRVGQRVAARSYSFVQYGSYAPVLRFLHDFYGVTAKLLQDIDRRMGSIALAPGGFSSVDDLVRAQAAFKRLRTEAASIQNDINAMIEHFAAGAPAYGMSAASEASVLKGMRGVIRSDGGNLVRDLAPICDAGDRLFDFVLAHRDEVVFDREGHFLLSGEKEAEKLEILTSDLEGAARQATRTLAQRQRNLRVDVDSVVPSLEGYRDW
jgi:hypothetical protein